MNPTQDRLRGRAIVGGENGENYGLRRWSVVARPIPRLAPVTIAIRPTGQAPFTA
jgi:hypothetical protein